LGAVPARPADLFAMDGMLLQIPNIDPSSRWWLILVAALTILYAIMRPLRKKKDPLQRSTPSSLSTQRAVERDMTNLLVELSEMARQVSSQLDTRALKLEMLMKEADQKLAALQTAMRNPASHRSLPSPAYAEVPPPTVDPRHVEVYVLADQGHTTQEIAHRLNRPRGEIELIVALRAKEAVA
jgi:hypothetical protein